MEQFMCSRIALYHWVDFEWAFSWHAPPIDRAVCAGGLSPHVIAAEFIVFVRFSETAGP